MTDPAPTDPASTDSARALEEELGYRFVQRRWLERAVTHRSYANEHDLPENYERLEFLGDAVLGLIAAEWLFRRYPDDAEGHLSKVKGYVVSEPVLAAFGEEIGLGSVLRLGVGEDRSGGRHKNSLLADSMEAVIGAIFLDGGIDAARAVVHRMIEGCGDHDASSEVGDAKTKLQEHVQARGWGLPDYRHVREEGPDHDKIFEVECWVETRLCGLGTGRSKKSAEQEAAMAALDLLRGSDAQPSTSG